MKGWRADELGFLVRLFLMALSPVLGLAGAGILITCGPIGWIAVFGAICAYGVRMGVQEQRRVQTAVLLIPPAPNVPWFRLPPFPCHGEVHVHMSGYIRWSSDVPETEDDSWHPLSVIGSLDLQVRRTGKREGKDLTISLSKLLTADHARRHTYGSAQGPTRDGPPADGKQHKG